LLHCLIGDDQLDKSLKCSVSTCPLRGEGGSVLSLIGCS
jgi:hypothetical protein